MSIQPWHRGTPERDPAELAEESARRRAERRELLLPRAELAQRSREIRRSATPAATPAIPEMCS